MGKDLRDVSQNLDDQCILDLLIRETVVADMEITASKEILGLDFIADDNYLNGNCVKRGTFDAEDAR